MKLTCVDCGLVAEVLPEGQFMGQPVLEWFAGQGERCSKCYQEYRIAPMYRTTDPATSRAGAADVKVRAGTQRHLLLTAYADGAELTADEAMRAAGANERSCYWKRVSELVHGGLLEDTGRERIGELGSVQRVNRITAFGRAVL